MEDAAVPKASGGGGTASTVSGEGAQGLAGWGSSDV